ncbi:MAG: dihydrolipoamide acetyltransferase family protein [Bdellovibrionota bacterium]
MLEFKMPSLGAEMTSGTLTEWKIKPGDRVKRGDIVAVVDTDKAAIEMEIWMDGVVEKLLVEPGKKVEVGTTLALLQGEGAQAAAVSPPAARETGERLRISPLARKRAQELGVNPATLRGTGPEGTITESDVERAAGEAKPDAGEAPSIRRAIAAAMSRSKREIPHYYLAFTIPMAGTLDWLERENARRPITSRLLLAALLVKAVAKACQEHPEFNGFWKNDRFEPSSSVHAGMAISLRKQGLIAPAILNAEKQSLDQLMESLKDLTARARAGSLRSSEMMEGTITITNLGDLGVDQVFGVIYPPQVALVGFGRVSVEKNLVATLSGDHRATDGARGALFLAKIGKLLASPEVLL